MSKIIGVTVGTTTSPAKIEQELRPVKTVNGVAPDANGNVVIETGGGSSAPGTPGYTPVKGVDYWTEADKAEIKAYVEDAILGGEW